MSVPLEKQESMNTNFSVDDLGSIDDLQNVKSFAKEETSHLFETLSAFVLESDILI